MQEFKGHLSKMKTTMGSPISYELVIGDHKLPMNDYLGKEVSLVFSGTINCCECGRKVRKSYNDGFCYPCTQRLACCDFCMMKPETCHYHQGTCREPEWGLAHCFKSHVVYLANSSGLKVGITRQAPTRWMDQGAIQALPIMTVGNRLHSGLLETMFKSYVADKTNWRTMLKGEVPVIDMKARRDELMDEVSDLLDKFRAEHGEEAIQVLDEQEVLEFEYPVMEYPSKIKSHNFDKEREVSGTLLGIKGQYLILSTGVLNVRKFSSYEITFSVA